MMGDKIGGPDFVFLPVDVVPGQTIDVSINLTAPNESGNYAGYWQLIDELGKKFGVGRSGIEPLWVKIHVVERPIATATVVIFPTATFVKTPTNLPIPTESVSPLPTSTLELSLPQAGIYDFVEKACSASWLNNNNFLLPCPGAEGDTEGYIAVVNQSILEDGSVITTPSILVSPNNLDGGYIQAKYQEYLVQPGDVFVASVSCEKSATSCSVLFQLSYESSNGTTYDLWAVGEFYDSLITEVSIDLNSLVGKNVKFVLTVISLGGNTDNHVLWIAPRIIRTFTTAPVIETVPPTETITPLPPPTATVTSTSTAVPTPTLAPNEPQDSSSWLVNLLNFIQNFIDQLFGN